MNLRRAAAGALALTTVIALGACTKQDNGNNTLVGRKPEPTRTGGPHVPTPAGGTIDLEAKDNVFVPAKLTAAAGDIAISMRNTGTAPHTFTVAELKSDVNADAGKTAEIKLADVKAGTYTFVCKYHESLKMVGELTVT